MKSIYNKKVLGVIFIITLIISIGFYFLNKEDQVDKDKLYENKLAQHNKKNANKKYGVSTNNKIARE
ncbi:gamma-glutamyltranspeptidase, partial [Staphylococcus epidermidis]|nr:gamma-glutamyltranspeptidase [Staphylococcus epidermidis]